MLVDRVVQFFYVFSKFLYLVPSIVDSEVMKSSTIIANLPISPFSSIWFYFIGFEILLFGVYTFRFVVNLVVSSFIIICELLSLVIFLALKSTFSDIKIAVLTFFKLTLTWFFFPFFYFQYTHFIGFEVNFL